MVTTIAGTAAAAAAAFGETSSCDARYYVLRLTYCMMYGM